MKHVIRSLATFLFLVTFFGCAAASAASPPAGSAAEPVFQVQRLYLKALKLEQPHSPAIFLETDTPKITTTLDTRSKQLGADMIEVTVSITVTAQVKGQVAYSVQAEQAGIFTVKHIDPAQMPALQGVACPNIIYPYLRANISDIIARAGFPALYLHEINWEAQYAQQQKRGARPAKR